MHLKELNLKGCHRLTDMAMGELGQLTSLEVLNLSSCWQITIEGLRRLSGIQGLKLRRDWAARLGQATR